MTRRDAWPDAMIARLRELHANDDMSFAAIADALNREFHTKLTKNSCIGKARRLALTMRAHTNPPPRKPKRHTPPPKPRPPVIPAWKVDPVPALPAASGRLTIYQLRQNTCRYPFGEQMPYSYCGNTTGLSSSWCPYHKGVVYTRGGHK